MILTAIPFIRNVCQQHPCKESRFFHIPYLGCKCKYKISFSPINYNLFRQFVYFIVLAVRFFHVESIWILPLISLCYMLYFILCQFNPNRFLNFAEQQHIEIVSP